MARRRKGRAVHGWLALDKPVGMGSTQALAKVRYLFNAQKAGHGGTLDPLASGLLPIAFGEATKTTSFAMDGLKIYRFTITWGADTDTDDAEGEVINTSEKLPEREEIEAALDRFTGVIMQVPPRYSAIKLDGARAYDLARAGEDVELAPREVNIEHLEIVDIPAPGFCVLEARCGKGTYVRAIARDLAAHLGTCGHVSELRRTRVGAFCEEDMISLEQLEEMRHKDVDFGALDKCLEPVATALDDIPALAVNRAEAARLKRGQPVLLRGKDAYSGEGIVYAEVHGIPVAIAEMREGHIHPTRVFNLPV